MDVTVDRLVSCAAHRVGLRVDQLIDDVQRSLRRGVPEIWDDPDIARLTAENVTDHVLAALTALEQGVAPSRIRTPDADVGRARRLARHGTPVSAVLRAFRLGQEVVVDRLLEEMPRLTDDAAMISAASRDIVAKATGYVERMAERGVSAYQEERDRRMRWRISVMNDASRRIGTTLDIARTTQELADFGLERFADLVTVDLLDAVLQGPMAPLENPLQLRRVAQSASGSGPQPEVRLHELHTCPDGSPQARALVTGRPVRFGARDADGVAGQARSTLVVPLCARDAVLGVAQFVRHRTPNRFDDEYLLLAQDVTTRAAVAVDNARRYTHVRAAALALQRSLLPRHTEKQSAVQVASRYLPAGAEADVGGDWYDVIPLSGARVALVVGDVVGRGIHAAATMGLLRTAVRTLADIDLPPDELLTHLDDVVLRLSAEGADETLPDTEDEELGATCIYAVYDPVSRCCTVARAGHYLPVVVDPDGTAAMLDLPPGPPLGLGGLPFESTEIELPEGSLLALYTTGLVESHEHDLDTGLKLLREALAQPAPSLEATRDAVLTALLPPRQDDDIALLLARTRALGTDHVADWDLPSDPSAVSEARSNLTRTLREWGLDELEFSAELVVSELVTNAIRYGRPPIRLRLIHDRSLLCEVSDASSTTPHLRRARTFDEGGRGLLLIAQLAERWGTRHARLGKTVWAELTESALL